MRWSTRSPTAHARSLKEALHGAGPAAEPLRNLMARESDAANILVVLRLWARAGARRIRRASAATGSRSLSRRRDDRRAALDSALRLPTRVNAAAELAAASRRPRWRAPLERFAAGDDLAGLQRAFEADRVRWAVGLFLGGDPLGVDVPIAYTVALENEARNLRLVGEAAAAHSAGRGSAPAAPASGRWRSMGRLIVITTPERELGYRLAGVTTRALGSAREAEAAVARSPRRRCAATLSPSTSRSSTSSLPRSAAASTRSPRRSWSRCPPATEADVEAERRGRLLRMLWQAVGYEITFDRGEAGR